MAVNFTKNQDEIIKAWQKVESSKSTQSWALFGYEGNTNNIKLMSTGTNGLKGLVQELNCSLIQYAFCRVIDEPLSINKLVLINWQGDSSPLSRKGLCASHVGDVTSYFKGCNQTITIRNDDEATVEYLMEQIAKSSSSRVSVPKSISNSTIDTDNSTAVGSTYKKTDIRSDISNDRKSFWQRQEEEEKARLVEEKKKASEKQAQFERERKLREESEAKKLADTIKERDKLIEATRLADKAANSQPSSMSSDTNSADVDDERVGRRSELLRLERNQETLSLISKGLIKNKRAIFEQATQNNQPLNTGPSSSMPRKASGSLVSQRLNTFKSLDGGNNVESLTNGVAKNLNLDSHSNLSAKNENVAKESEPIKIVNDETSTKPEPPVISSPKKTETLEPKQSPVNSPTPVKTQEEVITNGNGIEHEENGENNNQSDAKLSQKTESEPTEDEVKSSSADLGIKAKALYDYQAADNTEISFDPDDVIGFIEKVDAGWWHGVVITGQYKSQSGLFPANYVEEL